MANKDIVNKEEGLAFLDNDTELYKLLIESFLFDNNFHSLISSPSFFRYTYIIHNFIQNCNTF